MITSTTNADSRATTLPAAPWRDHVGLRQVWNALGGSSEVVRLVGGCVRDGLLGLPVNDVDLATTLTPKDVTELLETAGLKAVPTGIAHGTITAVAEGRPFEVTTLRSDVSTDGRRATVAFTDDWTLDSARRDFTINALYADLSTGQIWDFHNGLADLNARTVRFIGDARARIAEDHLRILRFFRFHARFGSGSPDAVALAACADLANSLMSLSRERIADELLKLLATRDPVTTVRLMLESGIFAPVLPEVTPDGLPRLERLAAREAAAGLAPSGLLRLAALLPSDPTIGDAVAARLKLSNKARKRIAAALASPPDGESVYGIAYRLGTQTAQDLVLLNHAFDPADAAAIVDWSAPDLNIGGRELMALGLSQGPDIARALGAIKDQWIAEDFPPTARQQEIALQVVDAFRSRQ